MTRPLGSKNKPKDNEPTPGNPNFNLNDAEEVSPTWHYVPPNTDIAAAAVTPEDMALEREIQAMGQSGPDIGMMEALSDPDPGPVLKKEIEQRELYSDVPITTYQDLKEQVFLAKSEGCDSVVATLDLVKKVCRDPAIETVGYFIYHDIKVYIEGHFERVAKRDRMSIEARTFGVGKSV